MVTILNICKFIFISIAVLSVLLCLYELLFNNFDKRIFLLYAKGFLIFLILSIGSHYAIRKYFWQAK